MAEAFFSGVIEGFYGQPWSQPERAELFEWMANWGLDTYLYAPKDDLKHRIIWRQEYADLELKSLRELIARCESREIRFVYALGPGLDIRYADSGDLAILRKRFEQVQSIGCASFAVLFDDIPDQLSQADAARFGTFAAAQCFVANELRRVLQPETFFFCPTPYCGRMASRELGGEGYLETIGRELAPEIHVFWTGPEIISEAISVEHIHKVSQTLRRKPVIWDNLHANDYDGRRFYVGPYAGRPLELKNHVTGILSNPNNEFPLNFTPTLTLGRFMERQGKWNAREEYLAAMQEWLPQFLLSDGEKISFDDLVLLGDCYYLPHSEGPEAEKLFDRIVKGEFPTRARQLKQLCQRLAALRDRSLFYALSRRIWDLREELDLLERFAAHPGGGDFASDFHLLKTYRGGFVRRLEKLLTQSADGAFGKK